MLKAVKPGQMMTKIVRDELAQLMGGTATDIKLEGTPAVILIAGLQGSGKTTFSGKLAAMLKSKKGRQVLLVAGDVYRPAAIDQLKVLGGQIGVEVYTEEGNKNPVEQPIPMQAIQKGFSVTIPSEACSYVQFTDASGNVLGDTYSNFYGQGAGEENVESFLFAVGSMLRLRCLYRYRLSANA